MERVDVILEGAAEAHEALGERLAAVAEALLVAEGLEDRELSLVLTDDENIRELNSEWRGEEIEAAVEIASQMGFDRIISNQPQYSMLYRVIESEVIPTCENSGIGQIVWSPLAQGVLTGKYKPGQAPPEGSRATDPQGSTFIKRLMSDEILTAVAALEPIAADHGLTMAQLALAWVLQNPAVSAAIIGATRPEQVTSNVKASGVRLEPDVLEAIDAVLEGVVFRDPGLTRSPETRP